MPSVLKELKLDLVSLKKIIFFISPIGLKGPGSPASGRDQDTSTPHTLSRTEKERDTTTPSSSVGEKPVKPQMQQRPSTPPPRTVAFEEFKQERGSEINRILNENKGMWKFYLCFPNPSSHVAKWISLKLDGHHRH
jgi:hypothetical protein